VIQKHPAHYFIRFLLTQGTRECQDSAWVETTVAAHTNFRVTLDVIEDLRRQVDVTKPMDFRPRDKRHKPSVKFLKAQRVYAMHHPNRSVEIMQDRILSDPQARWNVEKMLLARTLDAKFIANRLNARYHFLLTPRAIELYKHFFFDVESLGLDDWAYHMSARTDGKAMMSIAQVGAPLALYRAGIRQTIESKTMVKKAQQMIYMTLLEVDELPLSERKVAMLTKLTRSLLNTDERLRQSDMAVAEVLKQFERFRMQRRDVGPASIHSLAPSGNYSGSGLEEELPPGTKTH
jgi:hypothetical protein